MGECGLNLFDSGYRSVAVSYEHDNGLSGSKKGGKYLD